MTEGQFDAARINELLVELDLELQRRGVGGTIFVVGGAAMALAYNATRVTEDIDGTFEPRDVILAAAQSVAAAQHVGPRWLSDGVAQMMPPRNDDHPQGVKIGPALTISIASPEYVLAMKAMTSRQSDGDLKDAALLCRLLGYTNERDIESVVQRYFGRQKHFGAQELFFERIIANI